MKFYTKNLTPISFYIPLSVCLFLISLSFLGSCAGTQSTLSEDQTIKKDTPDSIIESKAPEKVNSNISKDSVNLSTALGLPIEVRKNETASQTELSKPNTSKQSKNQEKGDELLTTKKNASPQVNHSTSIIEDTFESNQKILPSNIEKPHKTSSKTEESPKIEWGSPVPREGSDGIKIAQKPPFYPTQKLSDIYFNYDAFKLDQESKSALKINAEWLSQNPTIKLEIHGHCDERGTNNYNLGLGEKRALTVKNFLTANGIASSRINTVSFGEEKPFCFEKTEECWKQNRRAHFSVSKNSL